MKTPEPRGEVPDDFQLSQVERLWKPSQLAWGLLVLAPVAFVIVATVVGSNTASDTAPETGEPTYLVKYVLAVMAVIVLALAFWLRRAAANPKGLLYRVMPSYLAGILIAGSLCVSVGVYGLAVFFMEGSYLWLCLFEGVSLLSLIVIRPRKQDLVKLAIDSKRR